MRTRTAAVSACAVAAMLAAVVAVGTACSAARGAPDQDPTPSDACAPPEGALEWTCNMDDPDDVLITLSPQDLRELQQPGGFADPSDIQMLPGTD